MAATFAAALSPLATAATPVWTSTLSKAVPLDSSIAASPIDGTRKLHILVSLKMHDTDGLKAFVARVNKPGSPDFGHFLTPAQMTAQYAPTIAEAKAVTGYLAGAGFSNIGLSEGRTVVSADATAAQVQSAFNTQLVQFQKDGRTRWVNVTDVQVPASLGSSVLSVLGVQNLIEMKTSVEMARLAHPRVPYALNYSGPRATDEVPRAHTHTEPTGDPTTISVIEGYPPTAWAIAYDAGNTPMGSNATIAISTYGDDLSQVIRDLRQSERENNLPYIPVELRITTPLSTTPDTAGDGEWDLDTQSSGGIAGNLKKMILYTVDTSTSLLTEYAMFADKADATAGNMSYGSCDYLNPVTSNPAVGLLPDAAASDQEFMKAAGEGLSWHASTGDDGGACSPFNVEGIPGTGTPVGGEYPSTSPWVVGVGGTSLFTDDKYNYVQETAWTSGGGSPSATEAAPQWQIDSGAVPSAALPANPTKGVPDIAMNAGVYVPQAVVESGAYIVANGTHEYTVGTSLSSPLATGVWARFQTAHCGALGFAAPTYYALDTTGGPLSTATGFNDITVGSNADYEATPGWDYTTGFGTIDIAAVNAALPAAASDCTVSTSIPTAKLTVKVASGASPFAASFDGSGSSDSAGDKLEYYVVDYGDGSDVEFNAAPTFSHSYAQPGTYVASLQVRNAHGTPSTNDAKVTVTVTGTPASCVAPGELLVTSPAGNAGTDGVDAFMGADDLLATYFSEPGDLSSKLVVTMKVATLATAYPGLRWVTYFNIPEDTTSGYYVSMDTASGTPTYTYGLHGFVPVSGASTFTVKGNLDASSTYTADGTITLVLDETALGLKKGDVLSAIATSIRTATPNDPTGAVGGGAGLTQDSGGASVNYTLVGNDVCAAATGTSSGGSSGGTSTGGSSSGGSSSGGSSSGGSSSSGSSTGTSGGGSSSGGSDGGSTAGGSTNGGGSTSGGNSSSSSSANGSGGAFGWILVPLALLARQRRRRS